jgi:hypothetical protein
MDYGGDLSADDVAFLREIYAADMVRLLRLTGVDFT